MAPPTWEERPGPADSRGHHPRALELYGRAVDLTEIGAEVDAIPLLEEALEIDPEFAMAHRKLSVVLSNNQLDPERADSAAARAYRLRDRLTEREQGIAEAYYFSSVLDDPERSSRAYERVLERYPDDLSALHNLGVNAFSRGDYETAEDVFERVVFAPFPIPTGYDNLARTYASLGRFDDAEAAADAYRRLLNRWSDPDPELAPVVENARARIAELTAGGP